MKRSTLLLLLVAGGCFAPDNLSDEMPDDLPAGACRDTDAEDCETSTGAASSSSESSTSGGPSPVPNDCDDSEACLGDDACVAAWDAQTETRGPFRCQFVCVPLLHEAAWCSDDASCCDTGAICTARGYCVLEESGSSGSGSSGTGS